MDWQEVERTGGKVVTYGSFKLGGGERDSDLDLLAVVPRHVSREDFFADFYHHLAKKPEVSELRALSKAFVPVIKFKYKDIDVDLTVARLMCNEKIPESDWSNYRGLGWDVHLISHCMTCLEFAMNANTSLQL